MFLLGKFEVSCVSNCSSRGLLTCITERRGIVSSLNLMVLWIITVCCCSGAVGHYCHLYYGVWNSSSVPKTAVIFSHFSRLICCVCVSVIKSLFFPSLICICFVLRLQTEKRKQLNSWQAPVKGLWEVSVRAGSRWSTFYCSGSHFNTNLWSHWR